MSGCITGKNKTDVSRVQLKTDGGNGMMGRQWRNRTPFKKKSIPLRQCLVAHIGEIVIGNFCKIRPEVPIKQMFPQCIQCGLDGVNCYRLVTYRANGINQKRNKRDMIQVCVCDKNMIDFDHLGQTQITHTRARIDQHIIIQQHRRGLLAAPYSSATSQDPELQKTRSGNTSLDQ